MFARYRQMHSSVTFRGGPMPRRSAADLAVTSVSGLPRLRSPIALRIGHQHADPAHPFRLLRARDERPRRRAAEQRDELAPLHSITSSASESRLSEILIPSALAVLRLITVSNLVGCSTGRSAGFAPLRILAV